jgi:hypothetical protein
MSAPGTITNFADWNRTSSTLSTEPTTLPAAVKWRYLGRFHVDVDDPLFAHELSEGKSQTAATIEEGEAMDWQEKYFDKLDRDFSDMKNSLRTTEERIAGLVNQALGELRDRDNQRHAEIMGMKADMQAIRSDNAETRRWIIGMVIAAIGVALAAIIGVVTIVISMVGTAG